MCPIYRYRATDWSGNKHRGRARASGLNELLEQLQTKGLTAVDLQEERSLLRQGSPFSSRLEQLRYGKAGSRDFMIFCRQFATLIQAGMSALYALQVLAGQMKQAPFRRRLEAVASSLAQGNSLAESFNRQTDFFPGILVHMLEAGEAAGALESTLERLAEHFEHRHDLEEKIRSATLYPLFISGVAVVVMAVMVLFVLPQFAQVFSAMGLEMPLFASLLLQGGTLVRRQWLPVLVLLLLASGSLRWYLATDEGRLRLDRTRLRLPLFGALYRNTLSARFARIMGLLLGSGLNLIAALELVDKVLGNRALSLALRRTREAVSEGQPLAEPLKNANLFPSLLVEMVRIGEAGGALEEIFSRTADFYEREVSFIVTRLGSMLEPILLLLVGLFVGALVFSILSPMYQVFQMI